MISFNRLRTRPACLAFQKLFSLAASGKNGPNPDPGIAVAKRFLQRIKYSDAGIRAKMNLVLGC
jgi:hypothetical protein